VTQVTQVTDFPESCSIEISCKRLFGNCVTPVTCVTPHRGEAHSSSLARGPPCRSGCAMARQTNAPGGDTLALRGGRSGYVWDTHVIHNFFQSMHEPRPWAPSRRGDMRTSVHGRAHGPLACVRVRNTTYPFGMAIYTRVCISTHNFVKLLFCEVGRPRGRTAPRAPFADSRPECGPIGSREISRKAKFEIMPELRNPTCVRRAPESDTSLNRKVSRESYKFMKILDLAGPAAEIRLIRRPLLQKNLLGG